MFKTRTNLLPTIFLKNDQVKTVPYCVFMLHKVHSNLKLDVQIVNLLLAKMLLMQL